MYITAPLAQTFVICNAIVRHPGQCDMATTDGFGPEMDAGTCTNLSKERDWSGSSSSTVNWFGVQSSDLARLISLHYAGVGLKGR